MLFLKWFFEKNLYDFQDLSEDNMEPWKFKNLLPTSCVISRVTMDSMGFMMLDAVPEMDVTPDYGNTDVAGLRATSHTRNGYARLYCNNDVAGLRATSHGPGQ